MKTARLLLATLSFVYPAFAELTAEQKNADFRTLSALFAKQYAPYEWKKVLFDFDLLDVAPWLDRVRNTTSKHHKRS